MSQETILVALFPTTKTGLLPSLHPTAMTNALPQALSNRTEWLWAESSQIMNQYTLTLYKSFTSGIPKMP